MHFLETEAIAFASCSVYSDVVFGAKKLFQAALIRDRLSLRMSQSRPVESFTVMVEVISNVSCVPCAGLCR